MHILVCLRQMYGQKNLKSTSFSIFQDISIFWVATIKKSNNLCFLRSLLNWCLSYQILCYAIMSGLSIAKGNSAGY